MRSIKKLMSLKGKRALITGANGGIGRQLARTITELDGDLILVDRPNLDYSELLDYIQGDSDSQISCVECDLENEEDRATLVSKVLSQKEPLNILINNAGLVGTSDLKGWVTDFNNQTVETWRRAIEVNLTAAFDLIKGLSPKLKESGNGSIINVGSTYGVAGPDYSLYEGTEMGSPAAYAATKGGLIQLTRWMATTLAPDIRVNAFSPGGVFRGQPNKFVERYEARTPLGRMATEEDYKGIVAYLASDLSAYVTGQNILVDGGWTVW